jgi:hypothetical protein
MQDIEKDGTTKKEPLLEEKVKNLQGNAEVLDLLLQHSEGRFD